jgi:hypothetical protein
MDAETTEYFADTESELIKKLQSDAFKAGRKWFKELVQRHSGSIMEPDLSTRTDTARAKTLAQGRLLTEERPFKKDFELSFDEPEYEYYSKMNVHYFGFRLSPEYIKGKISVRTKPKIRYKVVRQYLETSFHMWGIRNTTEDYALVPFGPMGSPVFQEAC